MPLDLEKQKNKTNSKKTVRSLISHSIHGTIFTYMNGLNVVVNLGKYSSTMVHIMVYGTCLKYI